MDRRLLSGGGGRSVDGAELLEMERMRQPRRDPGTAGGLEPGHADAEADLPPEAHARPEVDECPGVDTVIGPQVAVLPVERKRRAGRERGRRRLGAGGMGVVYTAHDPRLDRQVAIKVLPPDLTLDDTAKQRFLQEAKAASALDHPNICTIYEINETDDGQLYLVMAHYEGETLKQRIERGPLAVDEAVDSSMLE